MKIKVFNFLCRIATDCNFFKKNFNIFWSWKFSICFGVLSISENISLNVLGVSMYVRGFYCF